MSEICYDSRGYVQSVYAPCNPQSDTVSLCCVPGDICLTNGLCATRHNTFYNGACTDKTYEAAICPSFCETGNALFVLQCTGSDSAIKHGDFCCSVNGTTACCVDAANGLGLAPSNSSAQAVIATSTGSASTSSTTGPFSSGVPVTTTTSTSLAPASSSSVRASSLDSTSSSLPRPPVPKPERSALERNLIIGLTIGVVAVFLTSLWLYSRFKKFRKRRQRSREGVIVDLSRVSTKDAPYELPSQGILPAELGQTEPSELDATSTSIATSPRAGSFENFGPHLALEVNGRRRAQSASAVTTQSSPLVPFQSTPGT